MVAGWIRESRIPQPIGPWSCLVHAAGRFGEYRAPIAVAVLENRYDTILAAGDFPLAGFWPSDIPLVRHDPCYNCYNETCYFTTKPRSHEDHEQVS
jgi:hypothetical protein